MKYYCSKRGKIFLSCAVLSWVGAMMPNTVYGADSDINIAVDTNFAQEEAKLDSQQKHIITAKDIERKQAKTAEDIVFGETGVSRTVDAMGRVGVSIRGAEPRHTLILVDGQQAIGEFAKYQGAGDELSRIGAENLDRIEITQGAASTKYGSGAIGGVINVITKQPKDKPGFEFNMEDVHPLGESGLMPFSNFYLRLDSGKQGKAKFALWGNKRDVVPVYASKKLMDTGMNIPGDNKQYEKNALRFYGVASNAGIAAQYDVNDKDKINLKVEHYEDNLRRFSKRTNSYTEPALEFKRNIAKDNYQLIYSKALNDKTNLKFETAFTKVKEDDVSLMSFLGQSVYRGNNILKYVDNIDHDKLDFRLDGQTMASDKHFLSYGIGYSREDGKGSRLKNAPQKREMKINPFDYDKNITVNTGSGAVNTRLHDYKFTMKNGKTVWDKEYEWYGYNAADKNTKLPSYSYEEFAGNRYTKQLEFDRYLKNNPELRERVHAFGQMLKEENPDIYNNMRQKDENIKKQNMVMHYYLRTFLPQGPGKKNGQVQFNGGYFAQKYHERDDQLTIGEATLRKYYAYIADDIQLNEKSTITPSLRLDHSNLFGSNVTMNLGYLHKIKGNENKRFKANIGTAYSEPGMGELYYNWEMYGGTPFQGGFFGGKARMGWYWVGNPTLQPEKSFNMDVGYEVEQHKNQYKFSLFHNSIKNYLTAYFTGDEMDFYPEFTEDSKIGGARYLFASDMIYSFKNIGRATISGLNAEWKHEFSHKWSTKIGYTYLNALNKSDPTMPRRLLDKPQHKIDLAINYNDEKHGWYSTLYGNYYVNLIDLNDSTGKGNIIESWQVEKNKALIIRGYEGKTYRSKTYGIWNFMLQKKWQDGTMAYFGIDNLFNHRDDARALPPRTYRFGLNFKFGRDGKLHKYTTDTQGQEVDLGPVDLTDFFQPYEINNNGNKIDLYAYFSREINAHGGENRPKVRLTPTSDVGSAHKNMMDEPEHGSINRLTVGLKAPLSKNTNLNLEGSLSGSSAMATSIDVGTSGGLTKGRLEKSNITTQHKKWHYALGKIKTKIGTTGYWFNNNFVGAKAMYTTKKTQVSIGYGDFKHSTGITDSAYTRSSYENFLRPPTVMEFLGDKMYPLDADITVEGPYLNYRKQLNDAKTDGDKYRIMREMVEVLKKTYPEVLEPAKGESRSSPALPGLLGGNKNKQLAITSPNVPYKYKADLYRNTDTGDEWEPGEELAQKDAMAVGKVNVDGSPQLDKIYTETKAYLDMRNPSILEGDGSKYIGNWFDENKTKIIQATDQTASELTKDPDPRVTVDSLWMEFADTDEGKALFADFDAYDKAKDNYVAKNLYTKTWGINKSYQGLAATEEELKQLYIDANVKTLPERYYSAIKEKLFYGNIEQNNTNPRPQFKNAVGAAVPTRGIVLSTDGVPSVNRALFIDVAHKFNNKFGAQLWYFHSLNDDNHHYLQANTTMENKTINTFNDSYNYRKVANVLGLGFKYQLNHNTSFTMEFGKNMTALGKYLNGTPEYDYDLTAKTARITGYKQGSAPIFYTLRFNIGQVDFNTKGSWSGYVDYKHFEHGSFLGGNGTESLPDRYLDGIKSFTVGGTYVPLKNFMVLASYTFGAKGINKRDTLFGPESFRLGNYSRIEMIYKF